MAADLYTSASAEWVKPDLSGIHRLTRAIGRIVKR